MFPEMDSFLDFCIACDRQTNSNQLYCSESCRLAEYEKVSSNPSSTASSPRSPSGLSAWPETSSRMPLLLEPAFNFQRAFTFARPSTTNARPLSSIFSTQPPPGPSPFALSQPSISSSSTTSLHTAQSTESIQLSDESRKALRAYASAFDQSRYARRQSA